METLFNFLQSVHPLSPGLQTYLATHLKERSIPRKGYLLKAGHICRSICFIESGLLRCYYTKGDTEVSSWFMKEGDVVISIESFFHQQQSYETIQALEDTKLYSIEFSELHHIYREFPEFNFTGRALTERYYILWTQLLHAIRMKTAEEKYAWLLENFPGFILRIPAKYLASWLSISETYFSDVRRGRVKT